MAFAAELRPSTASIVRRRNHAAASAPCAVTSINALDAPMSIYEVHLGSWRRNEDDNEWLTYRELAEQLPAYAARHGLHPCRVPAGQRASVRRLLGLSADRPVRADQPLRHAGRFRRAGRRLPCARASACCSTGCPGISRRSARPRRFRRHRALRTRQSAAGPPPRLGHADLQLRAHRSGRTSWCPTRCSGSTATASTACASMRSPRCSISTTAAPPATGFRTSMAAAKTSKPIDFLRRFNTEVFARFRTPPPRRRNPPPGRRCRGRSTGAGSASATSGTWAGCTTR